MKDHLFTFGIESPGEHDGYTKPDYSAETEESEYECRVGNDEYTDEGQASCFSTRLVGLSPLSTTVFFPVIVGRTRWPSRRFSASQGRSRWPERCSSCLTRSSLPWKSIFAAAVGELIVGSTAVKVAVYQSSTVMVIGPFLLTRGVARGSSSAPGDAGPEIGSSGAIQRAVPGAVVAFRSSEPPAPVFIIDTGTVLFKRY